MGRDEPIGAKGRPTAVAARHEPLPPTRLDIRAASWYPSFMRARKLAAVPAPLPDPPPPEDAADPWPSDDEVAGSDDAAPLGSLCLACGAEGCREHGESARLDTPSRSLREALDRLRRTAAEHRAAARAFRVLVLTEVARGRGDLDAVPEPSPAALAEPCPRCALRDAEEAAAPAPKPAGRRTKRENGQQALPFKLS
jgi:hypothetical protein